VIKTLVQLFYIALLYAWCYHIHEFYFRFEIANQIALFLTIIIGWWIGISMKKKIGIIGLLTLLALPLTLQPIVTTLIAQMSKSWLIIFLIGASCSFTIGSIRKLSLLSVGIAILISIWFIPYPMPKSQKHFVDKVVASMETKDNEVQIVEWKSHFWLHYGYELQFSTIDKHVLAEAFTLPAIHLKPAPLNVLVLGGDNHLILNELSKSSKVNHGIIVPFDPEYFQFVSSNKSLLGIGTDSKNLNISNRSIEEYLIDTTTFDIIYFDYKISLDSLKDLVMNDSYLFNEDALLVFPSGNPYLEVDRFNNSLATLDSLGYAVLPYHAQVPTKGELSWILASQSMSSEEMKRKLLDIPEDAKGIWWNKEAMKMMLSFGKIDYFTR
jgi:predicted membrane-bound spermidine synthase